MALVLLFFFFQRDLGPALVISSVFLATYSVARGRGLLGVAGLLILVAGFAGGYLASATRRRSSTASRCGCRRGTTRRRAATRWRRRCGRWPRAASPDRAPDAAARATFPTGENDLVLASLGEDLGFLGARRRRWCCSASSSPARCASRAAATIAYLSLLVVGLVDLARGAGGADCRRPARPAAAVGRGHAVPERGPFVDDLEPRGGRADPRGRPPGAGVGRSRSSPRPVRDARRW